MWGSCSREGLDDGLPPATNRPSNGEVVTVELELGRTRDCKSLTSGGRSWTNDRSGRSSSIWRWCSREGAVA
jgi:hypothetical protein